MTASAAIGVIVAVVLTSYGSDSLTREQIADRLDVEPEQLDQLRENFLAA